MITALVAYDISSDGVRARVAAMLQAWGDRIQESVFVCVAESDELALIETKILGLLNLDSDALLVLPLCATCADARRVAGQLVMPDREPCWCVF